MANIKLNVDTLNAQSASMRDLSEKFVAVQNTLNNELTSMDSNWSSAISTSFSETVESMKKVFTDMIQELDENALKAEAVAYKYKEADGSIKTIDISGLSTQETAAIIDEKNRVMVYDGKRYNCILKNEELNNIKRKQSTSINCTSTAWAMGLQIRTGKYVNPNDYWNDGSGCTWGDQGSAKRNVSYSNAIKMAYDQVKSNKPVVLHTPSASPYMHAVTVVGVKEGVSRENIKSSDLLVVDPADGAIKSLDKVGYGNNQVFNVHMY